MPGKVMVHPIQSKRLEHVERLKEDMETKRQGYMAAVDKYTDAKINLERTGKNP